MELSMGQLVAHTALVLVASFILVVYAYTAYNHTKGPLHDPTLAVTQKFFYFVYVFIFIATSSQIIFTAMAWIKGDLWLRLSLGFTFTTSIFRECLWLKCFLSNRLVVIDSINRSSSPFGSYYISSVVISIATLNYGLFMNFLPPIVGNIAMTSATIIYCGQLIREWWKLFRFSQGQITRLLIVFPLLINVLLFGISTGVLICLPLFGQSVQPVYIATLICWIFVIKDYIRYCIQLYEEQKLKQQSSSSSQNSTSFPATRDHEMQRPENIYNSYSNRWGI